MLDESYLALFRSTRLSHTDLTQIPLSKLIAELFEWADEPIELNKLVNSLAYLLDLKDQHDQPLDTETQLLPNAHERVIDQVSSRVEERELLSRLWEALKQLPKVSVMPTLFDSMMTTGMICSVF